MYSKTCTPMSTLKVAWHNKSSYDLLLAGASKFSQHPEAETHTLKCSLEFHSNSRWSDCFAYTPRSWRKGSSKSSLVQCHGLCPFWGDANLDITFLQMARVVSWLLFFGVEDPRLQPDLRKNTCHFSQVSQEIPEIQGKALKGNSKMQLQWFLVGGWSNPFEKYARQIGTFSPNRSECLSCTT